MGRAGEKLRRAILELRGAVLELGGAVVERVGAVEELARAVLERGDAVNQIRRAVLERAGAIVGVLKAVGQLTRTVNCIFKAIGEVLRTVNRLLKVRGRIGDLGQDGVEIGFRDGGVELGLHARHGGRGQHRGDQVVCLVVHEDDRALLGVVVLGRGNLFREVLGDDELQVIAPVLEALLGVLGVGVDPAHALVCVFHRVDKLVAHIERRTVVERCALVEVDDSDRDLVDVSVRVVEGPQVQGAVEQRHKGDGCHGDLHDCGALGVLEVEQREADAAEGVTHS